ncbi:MAG: NAD(P)H-dependent oxidoreductase subunit E [Gemmatimonadota bacterium]|nr:MAG: NAD(P)H-dependent oxidoreductase subunit E [Gemmatimonadota bacterium]
MERVETPELALLADELDGLRRIVEKYKGRKGAVVPVLQAAQELYNYLPETAVRYLSKELDIPLSLTYRLATFYNAFSLTPKGKHLLRVCMGTACYVKGGKRILRASQKHLNVDIGGVTADKEFGLETVNCLGCCGQSPVVTVDDDVFGYVRESRLPELIRSYR